MGGFWLLDGGKRGCLNLEIPKKIFTPKTKHLHLKIIMKGTVHTQIENAIATITFEHPASNSCDPEMLVEMADSIKNLTKHSAVKLILLQSGGEKAFCAGASITHLSELKDLKTATEFFKGFGRLILEMKVSPKIIVTKVQGKAVGGGLGIIAASDYVIAGPNSEIRLSELFIGIGPLVIAPAVIRKIGVSNFTNLSLEPTQWKRAQWGVESGLFNQLTKTQEGLTTETNTWVLALTQYSKEALYQIKKTAWQGTDHWSDLLDANAAETAALALTEEAQAAFKTFIK